jgi:hypothetical protein
LNFVRRRPLPFQALKPVTKLRRRISLIRRQLKNMSYEASIASNTLDILKTESVLALHFCIFWIRGKNSGIEGLE